MPTVSGTPSELAEVAYSLLSKRRDVAGRDSPSAHLYQDSFDDNGSVVQVKFWSVGGFAHDCSITVTFRAVSAGRCNVKIEHCGDDGVREIEEELLDDLRSI